MIKRFPKYIAEGIGTFALLFFGGGSMVVNVSPLAVNLSFGLVVLAIIYAVGHISGAHLNPAVTIGFYCTGRLDKSELLPYFTAQSVGAVLACFLLKILITNKAGILMMTLPRRGSDLQAVGIEFILTFVLMFVIMAVATDARAQGVMAGVAIGATIFLGATLGGPLTGGSMNPIRSLAPALIAGKFSHQWIYLMGPILGSVTGAFVYKKIQCSLPGHPSKSGCC